MNRFEELKEKILPVLLPCGVDSIALFGSTVRGDNKPESDIDILVQLKPPAQRPPLGFFGWIALEEELSQKLGRKVDLVSAHGISPYIRPYVDKEKAMLYGQG